MYFSASFFGEFGDVDELVLAGVLHGPRNSFRLKLGQFPHDSHNLKIDLWTNAAHILAMAILQNNPRRTDRLVARITPEDKSLLSRAAALEGSSVATFVIAHLRDAAQEVIRHHESIQLNAAESQRFVEALLVPPLKPTNRFNKARELHQETVTER